MAPAPGSEPAAAVPRDELVAYIDDLIQAQVGADYGPNGLQVAGTETVSRLVTGVSACHELFVRARDLEADAILVHHGIFWNGAPLPLVGVQGRRVKELYAGELNLLAYHLPLDRDPTYGNNVLAAQAFGLEALSTFAPYKGHDIGFRGTFPEPISSDELARRSEEIFGQEPLAFPYGPERIRTLGIVSGGAQKELYTAIDAGLDAFITGEVSEWVMNLAREAGIHYLAAGHYATERLGVRRLGEHLAEHFGIVVDFIDIANPV